MQRFPDPAFCAQFASDHFRTSDGVRLQVLEAGARAAPVLALVPGWSMPAWLWGRQLAALSRRFGVAALDPRGQGGSDVPASGYDIERRSEDLAEFVSRYARVVLVGWSLGALEALHYVHRHGSGALDGLVLVDSSVGEPPAAPEASAFREALVRDRRAAIAGFVRGMFPGAPAPALAALAEQALRMPLEASLALFPSRLPREHWRSIAEGFDKPLLYAVTPALAEQAANLQRRRPATRVELFEHAGHALFIDDAGRFNRVLTEFLAALTP